MSFTVSVCASASKSSLSIFTLAVEYKAGRVAWAAVPVFSPSKLSSALSRIWSTLARMPDWLIPAVASKDVLASMGLPVPIHEPLTLAYTKVAVVTALTDELFHVTATSALA